MQLFRLKSNLIRFPKLWRQISVASPTGNLASWTFLLPPSPPCSFTAARIHPTETKITLSRGADCWRLFKYLSLKQQAGYISHALYTTLRVFLMRHNHQGSVSFSCVHRDLRPLNFQNHLQRASIIITPPKPFTSPFPGLFIIYLVRSKGLFIKLVCCWSHFGSQTMVDELCK